MIVLVVASAGTGASAVSVIEQMGFPCRDGGMAVPVFCFRITFDSAFLRHILISNIMAEIPPPNPPAPPTGAVPPPKKETGKVQPKKETVRINLPPKPTAAPTIKLPTLPPGGPTGAPSAAPVAVPAASAPPLKTAAAAAAAAAPAKAAAPATTAAPRPAGPTMRPAMAAGPAGAPAIKTLDKVLIFSAAVASLAAVGVGVWVFLNLKNVVETFAS